VSEKYSITPEKTEEKMRSRLKIAKKMYKVNSLGIRGTVLEYKKLAWQ
jgi:hypothetical protein